MYPGLWVAVLQRGVLPDAQVRGDIIIIIIIIELYKYIYPGLWVAVLQRGVLLDAQVRVDRRPRPRRRQVAPPHRAGCPCYDIINGI